MEFGHLRASESAGVSAQLRLIDGLILLLGMPVLAAVLHVPLLGEYILLLSVAVLMFLAVAQAGNLYGTWRMMPVGMEIGRLLVVWMIVIGALLGLGFIAKVSAVYSRLFFFTWGAMTPALMSLSRWVMRRRARRDAARGANVRILAFVGAGPTAKKIADRLRDATWMGLRIAGVYDDREPTRLSMGNLSLIGGVSDLIRDAREGKLDYVYITLPMHAEKRIIDIVNALADTTVSVYIVPGAFIFDMMHASWGQIAGYPVISVYDTPFFGIDGMLKRLEDIVLGCLILLLISPILLCIAIGVKLTSPGPVLFRQRRYGLNGQIVEVWKFRSMTVTEDGEVVTQARKNDSRVTPFGAFLRRTSLDELPQFFNVLQGRMSIVGPRPHAVSHNEQYRRMIHGYMLRHKVKPGITGWAQINGWRGETDTLEKMKNRVEFDLYYVRNWSLKFDLQIIFMTVFKGFVGKQAY